MGRGSDVAGGHSGPWEDSPAYAAGSTLQRRLHGGRAVEASWMGEAAFAQHLQNRTQQAPGTLTAASQLSCPESMFDKPRNNAFRETQSHDRQGRCRNMSSVRDAREQGGPPSGTGSAAAAKSTGREHEETEYGEKGQRDSTRRESTGREYGEKVPEERV
ncbi:hypothetical protein E5288_WYG008231 [Bos mutus]|uniref:Uncharacterized protein n=1 Tax=Bos mutus TaxID=72004 RepID=A0A6B0RXF6_9CETA|nr:hypothetical protein [Bos mutus]